MSVGCVRSFGTGSPLVVVCIYVPTPVDGTVRGCVAAAPLAAHFEEPHYQRSHQLPEVCIPSTPRLRCFHQPLQPRLDAQLGGVPWVRRWFRFWLGLLRMKLVHGHSSTCIGSLPAWATLFLEALVAVLQLKTAKASEWNSDRCRLTELMLCRWNSEREVLFEFFLVDRRCSGIELSWTGRLRHPWIYAQYPVCSVSSLATRLFQAPKRKCDYTSFHVRTMTGKTTAKFCAAQVAAQNLAAQRGQSP